LAAELFVLKKESSFPLPLALLLGSFYSGSFLFFPSTENSSSFCLFSFLGEFFGATTTVASV
jgi:hypothetical protein